MQMALKLEVTNTDILVKLHGLGAYWLPFATVLFCAVYSQDRLFTLIVILSFGLSHLAVWSMAISEAHFAAAIFWISGALIGNNRGLKLFELAGLILLSVLMIRSYESNLVFTPLLLLALFLSREEIKTSGQRIATILLVLAMVAGVIFALSEILWARDLGNRGQFLASIPRVAQEYYLLHFVFCATVLLSFIQRRLPERVPVAALTLGLLMAIMVSFWIVRRTDFYLGEIIYSNRILLMLVPAGFYSFYILISMFATPIRMAVMRVLTGLVLITFTAQAAIQTETMRQWQGYHRIFSETLASPDISGMTDIEDTQLALNRHDGVALALHRWLGWTLPILSVVWSPNRLVAGAVHDVHAGFVPYGGFLPRLADQYGYQYYPFLDEQIPSFKDPSFRFVGWSRPQADLIWSKDRDSRVLFNVTNPQKVSGRIYLDAGSFGPQKVFVRLNGSRVAIFNLDNSDVYGFVDFDPALLIVGENELVFRFDNARSPSATDSRKLAMYLKHIAIL